MTAASGPARSRNTGTAIPVDYDHDPSRFAANQAASAALTSDVHGHIAAMLADRGCGTVLDIGGGNGLLARHLRARDVRTVVMDRAAYVADAPGARVRADAGALPFRDGGFDGTAALWMLYHLPEPAVTLREAYRVLRPGGYLAVCAPSRFNDLEIADLLPRWGRPTSFDAENGPGQLTAVFPGAEILPWDRPAAITVTDRPTAEVFLRGRGLSPEDATTAAATLPLPLTVTKRGFIGLARKPS